ncbi:putative mediator of RNA polymerase II transcription subunit 12 [Ochlerotatus camptorhynchus]|uniref:putative mediator of RNA polymerase II transcription subunit 12 n=1 Tax=Ochlerotatus camptorhynchus TaxID=644619 RepID=UPI0031D71584
MKYTTLLLFLAISATCADYPQFKPMISGSYGKPPLVHPLWAAKQAAGQAALKQYMVQLRSGTRLSPVAVRPAPAMMMSHKRPVKSVFSPSYSLLKQPLIKRPFLGAASQSPYVLNLSLKPKFQGSPPGPKTGEIIYEKLKPLISQSSGRLTSPKDGAIHTIPAPNLASSKAKPVHQLKITSFDDSNHLEIDIHKPTKATFPAKSTFASPSPTYAALSTPQPFAPYHHHHHHQTPYPPATVHQYQVTEEHNNDVTLKDLYSGHKTYFAPDPDPSLPSKTLVPTSDPLSEPSNGKYLPNDLLIQAQTQGQTQYLPQPNTAPLVQKPYYELVNAAAPQPGYGIPLATQPQLQQHILQQTSMLQGMPVSLYNPTYLVTQSNNLFNNHQQQLQTNLFKPETSFLGAVQTPPTQPGNVVFNSYSYKHGEPAASTGQILSATQDQLNELQNAVSQIQLNDLQSQHSNDVPTYAQLVGHEQLALHQQQIPQQSQLEQELQQQLIQQHEKTSRHQLTEGEIANLLNYGTINLHDQLSSNDYYHYNVDQEQHHQQQFQHQPQQQQPHQQQFQLQPQQQQPYQQQPYQQQPYQQQPYQQQPYQQQQPYYDLSERQAENDKILAQAQQDLYQQQQQPAATQSTDYLLAYQEHQQAVANALDQANDVQNSKRATDEPQTTTTPLRIFVPDTENDYPNSVKAQKRMDELNYDYADDEEAANLFNTEPSVGTEANQPVHDYQEESTADSIARVDEDVATESTSDYETEFYRHYSNHRLD